MPQSPSILAKVNPSRNGKHFQPANSCSGSCFEHLALAPNILDLIVDDVASGGLIDERDNALLTYLVFLSRKTERALSLMVQGPSGSGKDTIINAVLDLLPSSEVHRSSSITASAFFRAPGAPDSYKSKILYLGERIRSNRPEQGDATKHIREFMSQGWVSKDISEKDETGKWALRSFTQNGPTVIAQSTTSASSSIFPEDLNRVVTVHPDVSEDHVQRYKKALFAPKKTVSEETIKRHTEFQQSLKMFPVRIPYGEWIAENSPNIVSLNRFFNDLKDLLTLLAQLYQFQRPLVNGELIATPQDYETVRCLLTRSILAALGSSEELLKLGALGVFTQDQAMIAIGKKRVTVGHRLNNPNEGWIAKDQVEIVHDGKGNDPKGYKVNPLLCKNPLPGLPKEVVCCIPVL